MRPESTSHDVSYQLQPVPKSWVGTSWLNKFRFNQQPEMLLMLEFSADAVNFAVMDLSGMVVAQGQQFNNGQLVVEKSLPIPIDVKRILTDIQWMHWPSQSVERGLNSTIKMQNKLQQNGNMQRIFSQNGLNVVTITDNHGTILLIHHLDDYQVKVQRLN
ncbi:hypothetical protein DS2_07248 [Catenovulum agarivorans DS-2]|uniref:Lipoprotein n=1 Tax=Catenovulum agarivorans DS-2 TaxID=1328313 RepID=W7QCJ6_9ALTE|nr:DUF3261 domain-containing protein [Catenovulum agarivorans]EWH10609.1 hypothetical protein DS2_07248 [Catenovulum agarivorans DS-2]